MKRISFLMVAIVASSLFFGCSKEKKEEVANAPQVKEPVEFIIANGAEPESLDPSLIQGVPEHRIYRTLFEGLVTFDPETAEGVPGVAKSWDISEDGTVYTFHLRDAVWSDGTPITAGQFVESWLRELNPETAAPYAWFPSMFVKGAAEYNNGEADAEAVKISAPDDKTFVMELVGPLPYVIGALGHYSFAVLPMHVIKEYGTDWTKPENFVSNGPFTLKEWVPQDKIVCVPNEKYWDKDVVRLDSVVFLPIEDQNTAFKMYQNGEIDYLTACPLDQIEAVEFNDDFFAPPQLGTYYYQFNVTKAPFDNPKVRKALAMSFDRDQLVKRVTRGGQLPAYSMVPEMAGYPVTEEDYFNIEEAKKLLAEAGYPNGEGFPKAELLYNTSDNHKKIAEFIQQQWAQNLGIEVELVNQEWKTYLSNRNQGNFQFCRAGWIGDYLDPNTFLDMFITGAGMNGGQYSNPEYDRLIKKAATMEPGKDRFATLAKAEKLLVWDDLAVMPIYYYTSPQMIDTTKWGGVYMNTMDYHPPKNIYLK